MIYLAGIIIFSVIVLLLADLSWRWIIGLPLGLMASVLIYSTYGALGLIVASMIALGIVFAVRLSRNGSDKGAPRSSERKLSPEEFITDDHPHGKGFQIQVIAGIASVIGAIIGWRLGSVLGMPGRVLGALVAFIVSGHVAQLLLARYTGDIGNSGSKPSGKVLQQGHQSEPSESGYPSRDSNKSMMRRRRKSSVRHSGNPLFGKITWLLAIAWVVWFLFFIDCLYDCYLTTGSISDSLGFQSDKTFFAVAFVILLAWTVFQITYYIKSRNHGFIDYPESAAERRLRTDLENLGDQAFLHQYYQLRDTLHDFYEILGKRFDVKEITFSRYKQQADNAYGGCLDNLRKLIEALSSIEGIDDEAIDRQLQKNPSPTLEQALRERLALIEQTEAFARNLLDTNELVMTRLAKITVELSQTQTRADASVDLAITLDELTQIATRIKSYDINPPDYP